MNYKKASLWLIGGFTLLRLIYINLYPLIPDEAYYWQWSRHLDWSYYEQGPILGLVIWIFTFFGHINTEFTVRLGAVVFSAFTMLVMLSIYKEAFPEDKEQKGAFFSLLLMNSSPIYSLGAVTMMHDTIMVFFLALFIYNFMRIIKTPENNLYWSLAGFILALGTMSKYTMAVVYFAVLIFLLVSKFNFKKYFKGPAFFTLLFIICMTPVFSWNYTHDWATFKYLLIRGGGNGKTAFTLKYFFELLGGQIGLISIFIIPFMFIALIKEIKTPKFSQKYFLAMLFTIGIIPFILLSFKSRVEANWPAFIFLPLFFLAAAYLLTLKNTKIKHIIYSAGFALLLPLQLQVVYPLIPVPDKYDPLRKIRGYKELAQEVDKQTELFANQGPLFISARHYQVASELAFYLKNQPQVYILIPHESSKNYRFWNTPNALNNKNSLFIYREYWEHDDMKGFFKTSAIVDKIAIKRNNIIADEYSVDFNSAYLPAHKGSK